jgi:hypothetical protein
VEDVAGGGAFYVDQVTVRDRQMTKFE